MTDQVRREVVKIGLDFRPIPVDVGDGVEWEFTSDPTPAQLTTLMNSLKAFGDISDEGSIGTPAFEKAVIGLTNGMSGMLTNPDQQKSWIERGYGLAAQQAIAEILMETWTGFPTRSSSPSGTESKTTGSV